MRTLAYSGGSVSLEEGGIGSFGDERSQLIALALCATVRAAEDKRNFVRRVAQNFKAAGIDLLMPWFQT